MRKVIPVLAALIVIGVLAVLIWQVLAPPTGGTEPLIEKVVTEIYRGPLGPNEQPSGFVKHSQVVALVAVTDVEQPRWNTPDGTTPDGLAYVSAWNNGYASALLQFKVSRQNGSISTERYTTGAFGTEKETIAGTSIESRFANYLGLLAVQPGRNVLTFRLETLDGVKVERVRIFEDSAIEVTGKPPPPSFWPE